MAYADLREFISTLEKEGEMIRVKQEVDIKYEVGAICRHALRQGGVEKNPALFFEKPKGFSIPIAADLLDSRKRYCMATGLNRENFWKEFLKAKENLIPPRIVKEGPCQQNVMMGKDVNLFKFPIPTWNEKDGGPYITLGAAIVKDPDTGIRNMGLYRHMVHEDGRSVGILAAQYRQPYHFMVKAHKKGQPLPVAISIGQDPTIMAAAITALPPFTDEFAFAGALRGAPLDLVKCQTIPLEVPATAEIILEGEFLPGDMREEGPFGEFTGYYGERLARPAITIKAITYRNNPIFECCYEGRPPTNDSVTQIMTHEANIMAQAAPLGLRKIRMCVGAAMFMAIASIKKDYAGQERFIASAILGTPPGRWIKTLIMVDEDIDPDNWDDVEWAMGTRYQPLEDSVIIQGTSGNVLDPSVSPEDKRAHTARTSKIIIDATKPVHRPYGLECNPKPDVYEKVVANWDKYGIRIPK